MNTVGFTSITLAGGYNPVSVSMVNRATLVGAVVTPSGMTGSGVTVAGETLNVGSRLDANKQYYLEITATTPSTLSSTGARFELDVAATKASEDDTITLDSSSPTNTITPLPDLSGCSFVVREHVTLAQVFGGLGNLLLHGSTAPSTADQIQFLDSALGDFSTYWLREESGGAIVQWRSLNGSDNTDYSTLPILPGVGVFVYRQPSAGAVTLRHTGHLRMTPFRRTLPQGFSLVSHEAPVDHTPSSGDMILTNGWKGAGAASAADQIQLWNGTGFDTYWFRANTSGSTQQWRSLSPADTTNYMTSPLLNGDKAILIRTQQPGAQHVVDEVD
jgi:hypothetical protein